MHKVMVVGAGKIGSLVASLLAECPDYQVHLADIQFSDPDVKRLLKATSIIKTVTLNVTNQVTLEAYLTQHHIKAMVSCLPFYHNPAVAQAARAANTHYFDLTEDISVTKEVKDIAKDATTAFVPQCGLAPGFISIVANSIMQQFEVCHKACLRVGALPQRANNALHYSMTWSTDGVINQYGNPCHAIEHGCPTTLAPLEGLESIQIEGCEYEAFNTSGGLGSLTELYQEKIQDLNYKTIRYPGHCEKMRFLMNDLKLNQDRKTLKRILDTAIPKTYQDVVLIYITVAGIIDGRFSEKSYIKKIYPKVIRNLEWSAIQVATAVGVCTVFDHVLSQPKKFKGLVLQENLKLKAILANRFAKYYA